MSPTCLSHILGGLVIILMALISNSLINRSAKNTKITLEENLCDFEETELLQCGDIMYGHGCTVIWLCILF